jgi:hypothetical protein
MRSFSSLVEVPLSEKLREGFKLASMHLLGKANVDFSRLDRCVDEYDPILSRYGREALKNSRVPQAPFHAIGQ